MTVQLVIHKAKGVFLMIFLDLASWVKVFIWSFISGGRFSIILWISLGAAKDKPEDEDGSIIGYTHKGIYIYIKGIGTPISG